MRGLAPAAPRRLRAGFVLPLTLFMLMVLGLLVALLLDAGVQELRVARGDLASVRARAVAESAIAGLCTSPADSSWLSAPRGLTRQSVVALPKDTVWVSLQALGAGLVRVVAAARSWGGPIRADTKTVAFFRVFADSSGGGGALRFRRLPGWWWAQIP